MNLSTDWLNAVLVNKPKNERNFEFYSSLIKSAGHRLIGSEKILEVFPFFSDPYYSWIANLDYSDGCFTAGISRTMVWGFDKLTKPTDFYFVYGSFSSDKVQKVNGWKTWVWRDSHARFIVPEDMILKPNFIDFG